MAVNGIEIKEGQVWKDRIGRYVTIEENDNASSVYIWKAVYKDGEYSTLTDKGKYWNDNSTGEADIVELISQPQEETMKEERTYTREDIQKAFENLGWHDDGFDMFMEKLETSKDPEYKEYLRLKAKFEKE